MLLRYVLILGAVLLSSCSTTTSEVRDMMVDLEDPSYLSLITLAVDASSARTSSQASARIYTLHHSRDELTTLTQEVARFYRFTVTPKEEAQFYIEIKEAVPDGGACVDGYESIGGNLSYSLSILTLGVTPATGAHCIFVTASLYRKVAGEFEIIGDFFSNDGKVEVLAGANEVDRYQLVVDKTDEAKALEASFAGLLNQMLYDEAFY